MTDYTISARTWQATATHWMQRAKRAEKKVALAEAQVEAFHAHSISASRDSEACDPGDLTQGAYWDGHSDAWLEAESYLREALEEGPDDD